MQFITDGPAATSGREPQSAGEPVELQSASSAELGCLLEEFRAYLLAIALAELPEALRAKVGASDLVQETMSRGIEHAGAFQGRTKEELAGWLRSILLNLLANVTKSYQTEKRDIAREWQADSRVIEFRPSPSAEALNREQWDLLQNALARLPDDARQAILFRHRENLTFVEIGERIGKSEEAARKIWSRAIRQLQRELPQNDPRRS